MPARPAESPGHGHGGCQRNLASGHLSKDLTMLLFHSMLSI